MRVALLGCLAACGLVVGCGGGSSDNSPATASQATNAASTDGSVITAPVDYLGAIAKAKQSAEKNIDLASINHAIQMFETERGRYPKDLNELVESHYLGRVPSAPYGTKLTYDPATGQARVVKQ